MTLKRAVLRPRRSSISAVLVLSEVLLQSELGENIVSFLSLLILDQVIVLRCEFLVLLEVVVNGHGSSMAALDFVFALDFLVDELRQHAQLVIGTAVVAVQPLFNVMPDGSSFSLIHFVLLNIYYNQLSC